MLIRTRAVYAADGGAAAGAAGGAPAPVAGAPPAAVVAPPGGAPARPDWLPANLELDQQFLGDTPADTISRLEAARSGLRKSLAERGAVPDKADAYQLEDLPQIRQLFGNPDDQGMQLLRQAAQQAGLTDKQFPALISTFAKTFMEAGLLPAPIDPKAEAQKLVGRDFRGNDAELLAEGKRRETAVEAWADGLVTKGTLTVEEVSYLKSMSGTAVGIMTLEKLQRMTTVPGIQTGGQGGSTALTDDQVKARTRDPRYNTRSREFDPAFAAETERLFKERFPAR